MLVFYYHTLHDWLNGFQQDFYKFLRSPGYYR